MHHAWWLMRTLDSLRIRLFHPSEMKKGAQRSFVSSSNLEYSRISRSRPSKEWGSYSFSLSRPCPKVRSFPSLYKQIFMCSEFSRSEALLEQMQRISSKVASAENGTHRIPVVLLEFYLIFVIIPLICLWSVWTRSLTTDTHYQTENKLMLFLLVCPTIKWTLQSSTEVF